MNILQVWFRSYLHPRWVMDTIAQQRNALHGALYTIARGLALSLLFYLPFYLLKFEPITPAYLKIFDTPHYFLFAAFIWPAWSLFSWIYLEGVVYGILRLLRYPANLVQILNLGGLLSLTIGIVLLVFDWGMVALNLHTNATFLGIAHIVIADPWAIALTAIFYKKFFGVPPWVSVLLGILVRMLYVPLAILFIRT
jgi:hypothetical protein